MFQRPHLQALESRIHGEGRQYIQVIYGPRQVGKTTLVTQLLRTTPLPSHYASADAVPNGQGTWISQQWEIARLKMKQQAASEGLLVVDELQKISGWSEWVKKEWDKDTLNGLSLKVIILGSSRLLLQKGMTESLAGRFEATYLGHWSFREMKAAFGLSAEEYIWYGGYPGAVSLFGDEDRWRRYVQESLIETSISKDILMLSRVDKPALMKRLFELGCTSSGQVLSYSKILGQLQDAGNTTTLAHYLDLLHAAGLLAGIEKFSPQKFRQRASSPKFQVHNTALMSVQQSINYHDMHQQPERWGRWVESAVGSHLLNAELTTELKLCYWRDRADEVDFVISYRDLVIGLEVKSGPGKQTRGMEAFHRQFHPHKMLVIGEGGLPWQEFLEMDVRDLF